MDQKVSPDSQIRLNSEYEEGNIGFEELLSKDPPYDIAICNALPLKRSTNGQGGFAPGFVGIRGLRIFSARNDLMESGDESDTCVPHERVHGASLRGRCDAVGELAKTSSACHGSGVGPGLVRLSLRRATREFRSAGGGGKLVNEGLRPAGGELATLTA